MPSFASPSSRLRRTPFAFVSSLDPTIDWEQSECTQKEYKSDPLGLREKLKHTEDPILIWLQHPTEDEKLIALGKAGWELRGESVEYTVQGMTTSVGLVLASAEIFRALAILCISHVENLTDEEGNPAPTEQKQGHFHKTSILTEEMQGLLTDDVLFEVGAFLYRDIAKGGVDESTKKPSGPSPSGTAPKSDTDTPTTAPPASETPTSGAGGDAMAQLSQTSTPESD